MSIAIPLMIAESIDSVLWITDTYFVSKIGDTALEAVGLGGYLSWLVFSLSSLVFMGTMIVVSQAWGARDKEKASSALASGVGLAIILGVPITMLFFYFARPLVEVLSGPRVSAEAKELAVLYFRARVVSTVFSYVGVTVDSAFRATGKTRPIVISSLAYAATNAVLDPILIYGWLGVPPLGVLGAGIASSVANVVFMIVSIMLLSRTGLRFGVSRPNRLYLTITKLGTPILIERIIVVGGHLLYLGIIARCGDKALAAHTIGVRIESLAFLPLFSLSEAVAALAGQETGANRVGRAKRITVEGAYLASVLGTIVALFLFVLSGYLPRIFSNDQMIIRLASLYLILAAVSEPLFGMAMAYSMGIRGGGNTTIPLLINLLSYYSTRIVIPPILVSTISPPWCVVFVWITMILDHSLRALLFVLIIEKMYEKITRKVV